MNNILTHFDTGTLIDMESDLSDVAWNCRQDIPTIDVADIDKWRDAIKAELDRRMEEAKDA